MRKPRQPRQDKESDIKPVYVKQVQLIKGFSNGSDIR